MQQFVAFVVVSPEHGVTVLPILMFFVPVVVVSPEHGVTVLPILMFFVPFVVVSPEHGVTVLSTLMFFLFALVWFCFLALMLFLIMKTVSVWPNRNMTRLGLLNFVYPTRIILFSSCSTAGCSALEVSFRQIQSMKTHYSNNYRIRRSEERG